MELDERLSAVRMILEESDDRLERDSGIEGTGFLSFSPRLMQEAVLSLVAIAPPPRKVLDLGCGNAGFALLAAAAGYDVYGIEIMPRLVDEAHALQRVCVGRGLIARDAGFHIVAGDMVLPRFREEYRAFRRRFNENETSMPVSDGDDDAYGALGLRIEDADIVYCWSWPTQSRFLFNYLEDTAKQDCVFVLPAYVRYTQGEHMNEALQIPNRLVLSPLREGRGDDLFIGIRAR